MKKKIIKRKIMIADDHPMMRQGLAQLIGSEPDLEVCCQADTAQSALACVNRTRPDLALVDITLPDKSGIELIKDIQAAYPETPVLVVSMHEEALYAERVLRAGGRGYIMKQEGGQKLMEAIRKVLSGQIYVSEKISSKVLETFSGHRPEIAKSPVERLTDREFEIFQLIGQGKGTREIAEHLRLSVKTVEVHRAKLKGKLQLKTGNDLVHYAITWAATQRADPSVERL